MKRQIVLFLIILLAFLLTGCASKLQNFSDSSFLPPGENKGIVVIAYDSDTAIHSLVFSGPTKVTIEHNLYDNKHNYVVTSMPAGTYDITRVKIYNRYNYIKLGSDVDENWEINVKPNSINYIGHFNINRVGSGYKVQTINNSTLALEFLQENYPTLFKRYPIVYGKGGPKDEYFEYIKKLPVSKQAKKGE